MNTRTARVVVGVALGLWGFPLGAIAQPSYRIVDVGREVSSFCNQHLLNQSGQTVRSESVAVESGGFVARSFLTNSDGTRIPIETGVPHTWGRAINDAGQVAGSSGGDVPGLESRPFLWTRGTGVVDLQGTATSPRFGVVCKLNNTGDVVGYFYSGHGFVYTRGRLWDLQNEVHLLGGEAWRSIGPALSINDAGHIFGVGETTKGEARSYILTPLDSDISMNLVREPGFEGQTPPALRLPGWVSDSIRQVPAKSEFNQPHTGAKNGACWATRNLDCGMYQELSAPATGRYSLTFYASADRAGGLVGANVNGATVASVAVSPRGYRNYGAAYTLTFRAAVGNTIRVWMYSPATPGYVVIDDVSLTQVP